ncbi:MAG TPA: hypothetical protein VJV78_25720 [Polyangiales bacterium]|nr:hypothetical protein [Polyangiales bacterium]
MRITLLLLVAVLAVPACASLDEPAPDIELSAPDVGCGGCYVVNAALAGAGSSLFVGGYTDLTERGVVRRFERGAWKTLTNSESLGGVTQLWATERELYVAALGGVHRLDPQTHELTQLEKQGRIVWAAGVDRPAVFDAGVAHFFDGDGWVDEPLPIEAPRVVTGSARSNLWVLGQDGAIAHSSGDAFTSLDEQPPDAPNDIWAEGDTLFAVSGDDQGRGKTGPGAILRWSEDHWQVLKEAPHDALLGVASAGPDRVYAVGATAEDGEAHPLVWRFDGTRWARRVITTRSVFLWDVFCDSNGACHAAGTDNTFLNLDDLD